VVARRFLRVVVVSDKDIPAIGAATAVRVAKLLPENGTLIAILSPPGQLDPLCVQDVKAIGLARNYASIMMSHAGANSADSIAGVAGFSVVG